MVDPAPIVQQLNSAGVEYVVIGGMAATLHGCPEQTFDLDIIYDSTPENRARLLKALTAMEAQWEHPLNDSVLQRQTVFALNTPSGDLDIFTRIAGLHDYAEAAAAADVVMLEGHPVKVLKVPLLIVTKEAANDPNPRKRAAVAFLKELERRNDKR